MRIKLWEHQRNLMPASIPGTYALKPMFKNVAEESDTQIHELSFEVLNLMKRKSGNEHESLLYFK